MVEIIYFHWILSLSRKIIVINGCYVSKTFTIDSSDFTQGFSMVQWVINNCTMHGKVIKKDIFSVTVNNKFESSQVW